jgi:hypothetical protein
MRALVAAVLALTAAVAGCSRFGGGPASSPSPAALDPSRPLPSPVPEVVARVNGQPIRIQQILPLAKAELDRVSVAERDRKKPEVLRRAAQYVDRELLLQEASPAASRPTPARWSGPTTRCGGSMPTRRSGRSFWRVRA